MRKNQKGGGKDVRRKGVSFLGKKDHGKRGSTRRGTFEFEKRKKEKRLGRGKNQLAPRGRYVHYEGLLGRKKLLEKLLCQRGGENEGGKGKHLLPKGKGKKGGM